MSSIPIAISKTSLLLVGIAIVRIPLSQRLICDAAHSQSRSHASAYSGVGLSTGAQEPLYKRPGGERTKTEIDPAVPAGFVVDIAGRAGMMLGLTDAFPTG
jgi:hypothetical protein